MYTQALFHFHNTFCLPLILSITNTACNAAKTRRAESHTCRIIPHPFHAKLHYREIILGMTVFCLRVCAVVCAVGKQGHTKNAEKLTIFHFCTHSTLERMHNFFTQKPKPRFWVFRTGLFRTVWNYSNQDTILGRCPDLRSARESYDTENVSLDYYRVLHDLWVWAGQTCFLVLDFPVLNLM